MLDLNAMAGKFELDYEQVTVDEVVKRCLRMWSLDEPGRMQC
jgi:hypothetical protein